MKYYSTEMSDNLEIIGHHPQAEYRKGYNPRKNGSFNIKVNEFPDFVPHLELQLYQKSVPTDYLSVLGLPFGMIISERLKNIFEKYKLPRHHFYKTKVYYETKILDYYWFHYIIDDFWDHIDKENSYGEILNIGDTFSVKRRIPAISKEQNKKEVITREEHCIKKIGKIVMHKNFPKYDLYKTQFIESKTLVSIDLKKALEENNITGIEITPFERFEVIT